MKNNDILLSMGQEISEDELNSVSGGTGCDVEKTIQATCPDCLESESLANINGDHATCRCKNCGRKFDSFLHNGAWLNSREAMMIH